MGAYLFSFVIGAIIAAAILNPLELYAQVSGQPVNTANWLWWLAPLAVLAVGFMVIRYLLKNVPEEPHQDIAAFGLKGGEVQRRRDPINAHDATLKEQEYKLRAVYESNDDDLEAT
jgi:hypothetical protein